MGLYKVFGEKRYCINCRYKTLPFPLKEKLYKTPVLPFEFDRCSGCAKKYEDILVQVNQEAENKRGLDW